MNRTGACSAPGRTIVSVVSKSSSGARDARAPDCSPRRAPKSHVFQFCVFHVLQGKFRPSMTISAEPSVECVVSMSSVSRGRSPCLDSMERSKVRSISLPSQFTMRMKESKL